MTKKIALTMFLVAVVLFSSCSKKTPAPDPKMICYSAFPTDYFNDHAQDVAKIYDGFFFSVGSWNDGVINHLGIDGQAPKAPDWKDLLQKNLTALKKAGVTENLLGVHFPSNGEWPSPQTLLSAAYTNKMAKHFAIVARTAKKMGFRGISIDTEYPYPRYEVDNDIYTFDGYTAEDLMDVAKKQGRAVMAAILDQFPAAVIFNLPGVLRSRPIERQFLVGLLEVMAERNAPGGFHVGTEYTYGMHDLVTDLATSRFEDPTVPLLVNEKTAKYWQEKCTIALGVWPLHIVETGSPNYPMQPWKKEAAELRQQMAVLRSVAKRYIWSYSGHPVWYVHSQEIEAKYGLKKPTFKQDDVDVRDWQKILQDKPALDNPGLLHLVDKIKAFDRGDLDGEQLCDAFGTPARWWVLGMLANPHMQPAFAAVRAVLEPIDTYTAHFGRDQVVRWFAWDNLDPRGMIGMKYLFDWQNTDSSSAHLVSFIHSKSKHNAFLHVGWDDGIIVYLGNKIVFDQRDYPKRGKGLLYKDRYQFEKRVPITIEKGSTRLSVTSINSHGNWLFSLRITDEKDLPFADVTFRLQ